MNNYERIIEIKKELALLPAGNLTYKNIKGKAQPYLQWNENGKTFTKYVRIDEREAVLKKIERKRVLLDELKELEISTVRDEESAYGMDIGDRMHAWLNNLNDVNTGYEFATNVVIGRNLDSMVDKVSRFEKRDCFWKLQKYINEEYNGKVCLIYGLRRTGKTTLLLQSIGNLSKEQQRKAAYIKAKSSNTMADINKDLKILKQLGYQYLFIDEVTLIDDFIDSAALFSDIYASMGVKIVLSGTDSLGFWFALKGELYDRAFTIHTTYIPFSEFSRLLGIDEIDTYIRYGGTLKAGEIAFDDEDAIESDASFRDDETTRRYIDTAICQNIQHSLNCCRNGIYFRHLQELYDEGELTGAINRIIESMNHQFLLKILTAKFKSHDLGSATQLMRKQTSLEDQTDILDMIDREAVTSRLMDILQIKNKESMNIGITNVQVTEIKEYLTALDLVVDCPRETYIPDSDSMEYVLFTQPGMRFCQAQALVFVLMKDKTFSAESERIKKLIQNRILEEVSGRMLEDIVLLETSRALPKNRKAFKLTMSRSEFDMVIYDEQSDTCELYEIKHSKQVVANQYHVLNDKEECDFVEKKYGKIVKKCVLYRGEHLRLTNGISYDNVEEYLKGLSR